ncbi:MAG: DUF2127 domain-containing protein [Verrucomicrobia bacterium]|jgi:uncharacterized membrane protein (DUF2068 family)|nr:DUF2127 domain-containing protein [Verrucomicrobiota bacterium]
MSDQPQSDTTFTKKRAPTLYVIIGIKLVKGTLLLLLALGVYSLSDNNLPEQFRGLLQFLHIDPEKKFFSDLENKIALVTPAKVILVAGGAFFYSLFSLVEGVGLIFRVSWAGWLAIGESAFFVPIEVYELVHRPSLAVFAILALNVFIVWYLFQNRHRLFRHHHH